jgi:aspartate kinase
MESRQIFRAKTLSKPEVMKFGGSSFSSPMRMKEVCSQISRKLKDEGPDSRVICVVSAPAGLTEQYRSTLLDLNATPSPRLIDAGLPLADSVGAVLVAAALQAAEVSATVALGNQIGLRTDLNHTRARLLNVDTSPIERALRGHQIVVVPGGQAASEETMETTWMGKNSSDLSAIALAAAFDCKDANIHSDVPGVYSSDPNLVSDAFLLPKLSYRQAEQMSIYGAKVLHHRGVEYAEKHGVRIVCRANHGSFEAGTVLSQMARQVPVVVPDARSRCYVGLSTEASKGAVALDKAGVSHLVIAGRAEEATLVVTCGFFDSSHFLLGECGLSLREVDTRLLTSFLLDGDIIHELVSTPKLVDRAKELHARYCLGGGDPSSVVPEKAASFSEKLAIWK